MTTVRSSAIAFLLALLCSAAPRAEAAEASAAPPSASAPSSSEGAHDFSAILEDYRGLRVGQTYDAAGRELRIGHLKLHFRTGTLSAVLTRSGQEAGFVYEGQGHYSYTSEDPGDRQSIKRNLEKIGNASSLSDGTLSEAMKGCVFVASSPLLADILGADAKPLGAAPASAASKLSSLTEPYEASVDHAAALGAFAAPPGRIVFGEIDGQTIDPDYVHDPVTMREERLDLTRTVQGDSYSITVSRQPAGVGWIRPPYVLTNLDYSLETANNRDATVKAVQTYAVSEGAGRVLPLLLLNHADTATNDWTSTHRTVEVVSVKGTGGKPLPFSHRYHRLLVALPEAPAAGSRVVLEIDLALHSLDTRGDQYYVVTGGSGFPEPWWENSVRASTHWKVRTKKPYRSFTGGTILARREEGDSMFLESESSRPTVIPRLIAGKFEGKEFDRNGIKVRVNIYGTGSSRAYKSYSDAAFTLLDVYGKALVPYPGKELEILEFKQLGFYQSPAGIVILPSEPRTAGSVVESRREDFHLRTFMHELAHQWFGNLVTPRSWNEDNWISESISEYVGAQVYAAGAKDAKEKAAKLEEAIKIWRRDADMTKDSVSIAQAAYLRGDLAGVDRYQLVYGKGALVVRMLHSMLGEDRFWDLLQKITMKYADKEISTDEFARETSAVAGQDMSWFFKQWIREPGIPDLEVSKSIFQEGGKTFVTGHLRQKDAANFKRLLLPFVYDAGGTRGVKLFFMDKPEQDYKLEVPAGASNIVVDPARNNLVYYH